MSSRDSSDHKFEPAEDRKEWDHTHQGEFRNVTMDNPYGLGNRSSYGSLQHYQEATSPVSHGRSVRDFEEQMTTLRKENFNLKLRLYFIEESIPGYHQTSSDGQDTQMKQLIDSKVEIEVLRKEIQEKQDILKEAAQAITQMELVQKETDKKHQILIDELKKKLQYYEREREMSKSQELERDSLGQQALSPDKLDVSKKLCQTNEKLSQMQNKISSLNEMLGKRDETIKEYEDKVKELAFQNAELQESLDNKDREIANYDYTIVSKSENTNRLLERLKEYEETVTRMNLERNKANRENHFFRKIIAKLYERLGTSNSNVQGTFSDRIQTECLRVEEAVFESTNNGDAQGDCNTQQRQQYTLKEKYCLNYTKQQSNRTQVRNAATVVDNKLVDEQHQPTDSDNNAQCHNTNIQGTCGCELGKKSDSEISLQYTVSDASIVATEANLSGSNSFSSIHANVSLSCKKNTNSYEMLLSKFEPLHLRKTQELRNELQNHKTTLADKICLLQEAEEKLKNRTQIHEQACRTIQKLMIKIKGQQDEINRLQMDGSSKTNNSTNNTRHAEHSNFEKIKSHFQSTGLRRSFSESVIFPKLSGAHQHNCEIIIQQQETTIKTLRTEIEKKTLNLQNLVNKELWEKNREIERLTKLLSAMGPSNSTAQKELQQSCMDAEYAKILERNQVLEQKLNVLIQHSKHAQNNDVLKLHAELCKVRSNAEQAERWRNECADVCSVLSNRLEELAGFLNSLLKHKDVLDALAIDKRHAMQKAVDSSLNLSKNLNRSLSISVASCINHSTTQLYDLSHLLCDIEGMENMTFNSHNDNNASQSLNNHAVNQSFTEQQKEHGSLQMGNASDSEWREQNRKVSMSLVGRQDKGLQTDNEYEAINQSPKKQHLTELSANQLEKSQQINTALQQQINEKVQALKQLQEERDRLELEVRRADLQIVTLKETTNDMRKQHEYAMNTAIEVESQRWKALQKEVEMAAQQQLKEQERLHQNALTRDWVARSLHDDTKHQLCEVQKQYHEAQSSISNLYEVESDLKQTLVENELTIRALKKQLDESALQVSKAVLERTKAFNDKIRLEQKVEEVTMELAGKRSEYDALAAQWKFIQQQNVINSEQCPVMERNVNISATAYNAVCPTEKLAQNNKSASEVSANASASVVDQQEKTSSPDLGIESDAGRLSGVEIACAQRLLLQTVELKPNNECISDGMQENIEPTGDNQTTIEASKRVANVRITHDCEKVEQENIELRRKLTRTKRAFEDTYEKLRIANQRKAQIEKDIRNQILKTHNVLKNVRSNMENDL